MKLLSFHLTSDHFLLYVSLSLLWGVTGSNTTTTSATTTQATTAAMTTTPLPTSSTTKEPPGNVQDVKVTQNESSITLTWDKVNSISTYFLQYHHEDRLVEDFINAPEAEPNVKHVVSPLTAGTKYNFTLITTFEGVNSTGRTFAAVTAPPNTDTFESVDRNETSVTLQWNKVGGFLDYTIVFDEKEIDVTASSLPEVTHTISELTSGTKYNFTLFTLFENVRSSGHELSAATAPGNVQDVKVTQNESSITLTWDKVNSVLTYYLQYNHEGSLLEVAISASLEKPSVTHVVTPLTPGTKYNFTLISAFEGVNSTGHTFAAVTAPPNTDTFESVDRNETSVTLQWNKVGGFLDYTIVFDEKEVNVTASSVPEVTHTISELTSGTKYNFTLFTLFENVRSSGKELSAATAPGNVQDVKVTQNESSITLTWDKVNSVLTYYLQYNQEDRLVEVAISASLEKPSVTHVVTPLTAGTKYNFNLISAFEGVNSTGHTFEAVTGPRNTEELKSAGQNETSITLQWEKVDNILNYILVFNEKEINVTASEEHQGKHTFSELTSMTKYEFTLFTVFENVRSSGVNATAFTAPPNAEEFNSVDQNETSITLQWKKVDKILNYMLTLNGKMINITATEGPAVTHPISELTSGTKYDFTLFAVFENVRSSGVNATAFTVPSMVDLVNVERSVTSITLTWQRVRRDWDYFVKINGGNSQPLRNTAMDVVSILITSLQPGTEYPFSVITMFYGLNSTAYEDFTVTTIDCANVAWRVTDSSIQGTIEGLFSNATATNETQTHVSPSGKNVSFDGLYPGATYEVSLVYERNSRSFQQCNHKLTLFPPYLSAHCEYWAAGYSVLIVWKPKSEGVWTSVEVNVTGKNYPVLENGERHLEISGFQPAKTYEVSIALLSGTVRSYQPFVFLCPTDPRGVIGGSVVAVLLFALLVCLAVFIFLKRPDIISRKKPFIGGFRQSNKRAISLAKFPDHFHQLGVDENRGFSQEYESLFPVGTEQTRNTAILPENKTKNRFNNIQPYDWCRVKLTTSSPNGTSDYINASYMPGYNSNREYIASQGPLPSTVDDFWRMIWEQRVKGIVMVTNCTEGGRTKCEQYWPADSKPCPYGELLVTIMSEQQEPDWTLREFSVKHRDTSEERTVKHFHFTVWPDHGVPQNTEVLIQFRGLVRRHIEKEGSGAPTVVHCSAGVGRTGTIIALDVLLQQLEKERAVGINGFVHKMRLNRPHMVQTESQYIFLHQCIMDCLKPHEKPEENIYENADMIYANATALREL